MSILQRKLYSDTIPISTLIDALEEQEVNYHDYTIDSSNLFMDKSTGNIVIKNGSYSYDEYPMQEQALQLLLARLEIPTSYAKKCPPELLSENVNFWLKKYNKDLFLRFDRNNIRAILTPKYNPVSNLEMVKQLYKYNYNPDIGVRYELTPSRFIAQFISPERMGGVDVGDPCQYGIHLSNSETGHASVMVRGMLMRIICSNGMVSPSVHNSWSRTHRSKSNLILAEMESSIESATKDLPRILKSFYATRDVVLNNMEQVLKNISILFKLTEAQQEEIQKHVESNNLYNLINAFTHAGSHKNELSLIAREELQKVGGNLIMMDSYKLKKFAA